MTKDDTKESSGKVSHVSKDEVGSKARKGVKWTALQIIARNILSLGTTAVLARLLTPEDFGLIGMVATLTALLMVFSDMGLSWATIQRQALSKIQVSNLFWINLFVGLFLWVICIFFSPLVASFYDEPKLTAVTAVLGAGFLLSGLAAQPIALLNRSMNYKAVAQIEVLSIIAGAIAALYAAYTGLGYWALVIQGLTSSSFRAVLAIRMSKISLYAPKRNVDTLSLVSFGGTLALNGLLIYMARNLDSVLIGKYWGAEELGYYNRAYFLMLLPSMLAAGVLNKLMVPSLSAFQDDPQRFGNAYRKALVLIALVGCPMALGLALTADEMVMLVYGKQWQPVVPILLWLSIASITQPLFNTTGWLFTSVGKAKHYLWLTLISGVLLTISFFFAISGGGVRIAQTYGIVMGIIIFFPSLWYAHNVANISFKYSLKTLTPIALSLLLMGITVSLIDILLNNYYLSWISILIIKIISGVISYVLYLYLFAKKLMKDILKSLKILKS
ncbi:lipopolysaccharide biosynthesis protein [Psychrobacter sp. UBA6291]|uniref:lipopolysaccharide biosynthesis protein n=1 Tax=Psychrobacter sp. UBA6291 TaxID=1947357 RepID=UPI00257EAD37|nr:lipopolysaccharide biosynthesis protein [Psychrobacter sp. UBA6291]